MDELQPPQNLIDKELNVIVGEALRADDVVQVRAHQVRHKVDLCERFQGLSVVKGVEQANNVLVVHL